MHSWIDRDKASIWHPFTPQKSMPSLHTIVKAEKAILIDEFGNQYIDAISSWWVTTHGHAHPYIADKIYQQAKTLEQVIFAGFTHQPAILLAENLLKVLPTSVHRIFFSDNGSTSTEVAIKMCIQYWWNKGNTKKKLLAFKDAYHGDTFGAMSVSDRSVFTLPFQQHLFDIIEIPIPNEENITSTLNTIREHAYDIAAFIYEPLVLGAGGMKMYEPKYLDEILRCNQAEHILNIADEVMTGFGRTGTMFASQQMQHKPDIICLSKGLTAGTMPLGVTACSQNIYEAFCSDEKMKTFFHGHSFTANPIACTAALANLELWEMNQTHQLIEEIKKHIHDLKEDLMPFVGKTIKNLRQLGTILAFEVSSGKDGYLNQIAYPCTDFCLKHGVYLRPLGNTVYIMPPYCITPQQLKKIFEVIRLYLLQL